MKPTGIIVTQEEERHFRSIAKHILPLSNSISNDMSFCQCAEWAGYDRAYVLGKIQDLEHNMKEMQLVLDDMLPGLW